MIGWFCFAGYLLAAVVAAKVFLWFEYRDWKRKQQSSSYVRRRDWGDDGEYGFSVLVGMFWPVVLIGWAIYGLFVHVLRPLVSPAAMRRDRAAARARAEQERAAEQARKYKLPMPGGDRG